MDAELSARGVVRCERGDQYPSEHRNVSFAAQHGFAAHGLQGIYLPMQGGRPTGEYVDFMTGFVTPEGRGRPVAVAVGHDGALFVSDDGGNAIWRVSYTRGKGSAGMHKP